MSKKHFEALAEHLRKMRPARVSKRGKWAQMVRSLADFCQTQNWRFNRTMFLTACGLEE